MGSGRPPVPGRSGGPFGSLAESLCFWKQRPLRRRAEERLHVLLGGPGAVGVGGPGTAPAPPLLPALSGCGLRAPWSKAALTPLPGTAVLLPVPGLSVAPWGGGACVARAPASRCCLPSCRFRAFCLRGPVGRAARVRPPGTTPGGAGVAPQRSASASALAVALRDTRGRGPCAPRVSFLFT